MLDITRSTTTISNLNYTVLNKADINRNIFSVCNVLQRSVDIMISPQMMHFIVQARFDEMPVKLIQKIKETYASVFLKHEKNRMERLIKNSQGYDRSISYRIRKRKCPEIEIIYSFESKMLKTQYDHIHFMFIVDFGNHRFDYTEIISILNETLGSLSFVVPIEQIDNFSFNGFKGINRCGYCRYRNKNSTIKGDDVVTGNNSNFKEVRGHDLKTEFNDAVIRASYLCKSEQKSLLPDHLKIYSFGHTRAKRAA